MNNNELAKELAYLSAKYNRKTEDERIYLDDLIDDIERLLEQTGENCRIVKE